MTVGLSAVEISPQGKAFGSVRQAEILSGAIRESLKATT